VVAVLEPLHVPGVPDQKGGHDRAHAVELDDTCPRRPHRLDDAGLGVGDLGIETTDIGDESESQALSFGLGGCGRLYFPQYSRCPVCRQSNARPTRD